MKQPEDNKTADLLETSAKRGRKPTPSVDAPTDIVHPIVAGQYSQDATEMTLADDAVMNMASVFTTMGRMQAFQFVEAVSARALIQTYEDAKAAIGKVGPIPYRKPDGSAGKISNIDEFCQLALGKTDRRIRQIIANRNTVGEDMFEAAEAIGLRERDYAAIRALPSDSQDAVRLAIDSGDRDQVLNVIQEFAVRAEAAKKEAAELTERVGSLERIVDDKNKVIDTQAEKLARPYKPGKDAAAKTAQEKIFLDALEESAMKMKGLMTTVTEVMTDMSNEGVSQSCLQAAHVNLQWLAHSLAEVMTTHGIELDLSELVEPTWVREAKKRTAGGGA